MDNSIIILSLTFTAVIIILSAAFLYMLIFFRNRRNKELLEQQDKRRRTLNLQTGESDRHLSYLGRRIHDRTLQELGSVHIQLMIFENKIQEQGIDTGPLRQADATVCELMNEANDILHTLNTGFLKSKRIELLLERELERWQEAGGFDSWLEGILNIDLHPYRKLLVFRIAEEAIANIVRHASASKVEAFVTTQDNQFVMRIKDNGIGFISEKIYSAKTYGIDDMHFRAQCLNGELDIDSAPGAGTTVTLRIPVDVD